jgi:hypothetical protein
MVTRMLLRGCSLSPGKLTVALIILLAAWTAVDPLPALGQEIPAGVRYKRASEAVNAEAKAALEEALTQPGKPPARFAKFTTVVGPMLWKELDPAADSILREAKGIMVFIQTPKPILAEGGRMLSDESREAFWKAVWELYPELKSATVRKAKAKELSYYWSTIVLDIEEPFFTLDTGKHQFIVNIMSPGDKEPLFWIDLVGDLNSLARRKK